MLWDIFVSLCTISPFPMSCYFLRAHYIIFTLKKKILKKTKKKETSRLWWYQIFKVRTLLAVVTNPLTLSSHLLLKTGITFMYVKTPNCLVFGVVLKRFLFYLTINRLWGRNWSRLNFLRVAFLGSKLDISELKWKWWHAIFCRVSRSG